MSWKVRVRVVFWILVVWAVAAYFLAPWAWERYVRRHPQFADVPGLTQTADGHPGDPLNVAIVGTEEELLRAMHAAGWVPADPITFRSSVRIVADSLLKRPDDSAPVSDLYLFGRKQDLAFEKPVGESPRQRHHVRFWQSAAREAGRPVLARLGHVRRARRSQSHDRRSHAPHRPGRRRGARPHCAGLADRGARAAVLRGARLSQGALGPQWRRRRVAHRR